MDTPVPISNTEVKHFNGEDSVSENSKLPIFFCLNICYNKIGVKMKKSIKKYFIIVFIILCCIIAYLFLFKNQNLKYNVRENDNNSESDKLNSKDIITNNQESNSNIIGEYVSSGMNIDSFKSLLSKERTIVKKTKEYKKTNYNFDRHLHYKELEDIYTNLNNSNAVELEIIGKSYDNKNLYSIEVGFGKDKIMFEGNIHAAEIAPVLFLTKYAVDLVNKYESNNQEIIDFLNEHKIVIVPTVNPDGYEYSIFGKSTIDNKDSFVYKNDFNIEQDYYKANINGVDLNRNFPSQTGGLYYYKNDPTYTLVREKSTERLEYFPGYSLGSEPEVQALIYWMYEHYKSSHAYISIHSAGQVIYNGKPSLSDEFNILSEKCAEIVNEYTDYEILGEEYEDEGYGADGTSTDMISEIIHGYKMSKKTGRLSTNLYDSKSNNLINKMCILTIETLENYTQNLNIIKNEYYDKNLNEVFTKLTKFEP